MEIDSQGRFVARPESDRFWEKVKKTESCWLWTSVLDIGGYGHFKVKVDGKHRYVKAHRWAYEHEVGPIPQGLALDHLCNVRACVNPVHLRPATTRENNARAWDRPKQMATRDACSAGHAYTAATTYVTSTGWRQCRICGAERASRYRTAKKQRGTT